MSPIDVDRMISDLRAQLEREGRTMQGLSLDDLGDALRHPEAAASVMEVMAREMGSVQVGDRAPDFCLPRLGADADAARVRLSDHLGSRPVALVFGSYT